MLSLHSSMLLLRCPRLDVLGFTELLRERQTSCKWDSAMTKWNGLEGSACDHALGHMMRACRYTTQYTQIYTSLNGTWPLLNYTSPVRPMRRQTLFILLHQD